MIAAYASLALAIGIAIYVLGSFLVMRPHTDPRPWRESLRAALRETFWVILTQPLLPLWYVIGRRMGGKRGNANAVPVVFVHGYFQNRVDFLGLARALARAHEAPLFAINYPWTDLVPNNAKRLARFVERVCEETGAAQVDLVCHSLGGVVALEYIYEMNAGEMNAGDVGGARVRRCVTVASPHAGVAWKGPVIGTVGTQVRNGCAFLVDRAGRKINVPCLSIYSTHDNIVHPPATSALAARGGFDLVVDGIGHLSLLFTPKVHDQIVSFLRAAKVDAGSFPPPPPPDVAV
jgi:triacylglycerol lipase